MTNLLDQAPVPARTMAPIIRITGMEFAGFISLTAVDQTRSSTVKESLPASGNSNLCEAAHRKHGDVVFLSKVLGCFRNVKSRLVAEIVNAIESEQLT